jgi:hypothetical protein
VVGCDIKDIGGVFVEETIKIKWNEKEEEVVIGRLSFGQRNEAIRKCLKTKLQGTQQTRDVDEVLLKELNLLYSIKKAPFGLSPESEGLKNIRSLDFEDGDNLYGVCEKVNGIGGATGGGDSSADVGGSPA